MIQKANILQQKLKNNSQSWNINSSLSMGNKQIEPEGERNNGARALPGATASRKPPSGLLYQREAFMGRGKKKWYCP